MATAERIANMNPREPTPKAFANYSPAQRAGFGGVLTDQTLKGLSTLLQREYEGPNATTPSVLFDLVSTPCPRALPWAALRERLRRKVKAAISE